MKKNISGISIGLLLMLTLPTVLYAQTASDSSTPAVSITNTIEPTKSFRIGPTVKAFMQDRNDASHAGTREFMSALKTKMAAEREQFQNKLQLMRDERKKNIIIKLDAKIASISSRKTTQMTKTVSTLGTILGKIKTKAAAAKASGIDTTAVDAAIVNADKALASASAAIATQAANQYTINITTDDALKSNVGTTIKQFEQDMRTTFKSVKDAKQAVLAAARELKKVTKPTGTEQ
jgi:hypothetical protein